MQCIYPNGFTHTKEQAEFVGSAINRLIQAVKVVWERIKEAARSMIAWFDEIVEVKIEQPKRYWPDHRIKPLQSQVITRRPRARARSSI